MANVGNLFVSLILDSTRYAAGLSETTKKTNKTVRAIQKELRGLVNFAIGAGGFYAVVRGIQAVTAAAAAQEEATLRLSQTLRNNYQFTDANLKALDDQATALQRVTRYGDDVITSAQSQLMAIGKLNTQGVQQITPAILDFATAMGMDLVSAAELVAKTLGSQTNSLARYGIQIDMTKQGAERLAELQERLNAAFKGQAEVQGFTTAITQAKNVTGDFAEELGAAFTNASATYGIMKLYKDVIGGLADNMKKVREQKDFLEKYAGTPMGKSEYGAYYTPEQLSRAKYLQEQDNLEQQFYNEYLQILNEKREAEKAANEQRIKDAEKTAKELEATEKKLAEQWLNIVQSSNQAAYDEIMGREDVWATLLEERKKAAENEIAANDAIYAGWSDFYEMHGNQGKRSWEEYYAGVEKSAREMESLRGEVISFSQQFSTVLANSATQSGNVFANIANNFGRMLEVMAADLAAKSAIFGILSVFAPGLMAGAGLTGKSGFASFLGLPGFADGGMVGARKPILVGERGPEIFMPSGAGKIIPNNEIDQSSISVVFNGTPGNIGSRLEMVNWMRDAWRRGELKFLTN